VRWSTVRSTRRASTVELAVCEVGDPSAPAAVIAHGVGSCVEFAVACWADGLQEAGFRLVTYDLRGHARSTPLARGADQALIAHAGDLAVVCRTFQPRLVGGFSLGGIAALHYAADLAAEHALDIAGILVGMPALLGPGTPTGRANTATADVVEADGVSATLADIAADDAVPRWVVEELYASWPRHRSDSLVAALRRLGREPALDLAVLALVTAPVGVAAFADDPAHPRDDADVYAAALPNAVVAETTLAAVGADRGAVGRTAVAAWRQAATLSGSR
jgi:pimeloyl-ACP methyl ester carboxylesterase